MDQKLTCARLLGYVCVLAVGAAASGCGSTPTAPTGTAVTSIAVSSPGTSGATFQLTALARMSDNSTLDVTQTAAWVSSNTLVATISPTGLVTVQASGEVDLRATYRSVSGSLHAVVVRATLVSVTLSGITDFNAPFQLTATARMSDGSRTDVTNLAAWDSSNSARATVSSTGLVRIVGDGDVDIRVTYQGMTDEWHLSRGSATEYFPLSGLVVGTDGQPIAGAEVRILESSVSGNPTLSDASGRFTFPALAAGRHLIEVTKAGYQTSGMQIVTGDGTPPLSIVLRRIGE